jgi:hypothetical protein
MTYDGVARVITETSRSTVGVALSSHLFRTSIASSAAISNPHLASALLHHTDPRVTEAHYNRASSLSASAELPGDYSRIRKGLARIFPEN